MSEKYGTLEEDKEKPDIGSIVVEELLGPTTVPHSRLDRLYQKFTSWILKQGLEGHGIEPTTTEQRSDRRIYQVFFLWFAANLDIQNFACSSVAPIVFGLGIRTSSIIVIIVDILACIPPAYFAVFGTKLGTRAMVLTRFSWGYYGTIFTSILNVATWQGFLIVNVIIGGQTLAAASSHLDASLGIVIIGLISLAVTFCGYQTLHWYEMVAWIPNVVGMVVLTAVGAKALLPLPLDDPTPPSAASIMTFASALTVTMVGWSPIVPDYSVFHDHKAPSWKVFLYAYLGLVLSAIPMHLLGVAFSAGALYYPEWGTALGEDNNVGKLVAQAIATSGNFGKALLVLMALTTPSGSALTMHAACVSLMTVSPVFAKVPRAFIAVVSTAILIPVGIVGAKQFFATFLQIISLVGYWIGPWIAIVLIEHFVFRRKWSAYQTLDAWDKPRHPNLAPGYAAMFTFLTAIPVIVVCMSQAWYVGPVAKAGAGDVGMLVSFAYSSVVYTATRYLERRWVYKR